MSVRKLGKGRWRAAAAVAVLAASGLPAALGFDTGHHADLTFEVLQREGFGGIAIQAVQVENWLADYYTATTGEIPVVLTSRPPNDIAQLRLEFGRLEPEMSKLHFDNLQDTEQVRNYWAWLTRNTRAAVQEAARDGDALRGLTLMGLSLHAVQDFYTHSNWVEAVNGTTGAVSRLRMETWSTDPAASAQRKVWTGFYPPDRKAPPPLSPQGHGGYTDGMNHDSYVRPNWLPAYAFAHAASRQWVDAIHAWVKEVDRTGSYWKALQTYQPSPLEQALLAVDSHASYRISEWVNKRGHNGHWKGNGSGSDEFLPFTLAWAGSPNSPFVDQVRSKHTQLKLIANLASDGSRIPPLPAGEAPATVPALVVPTRALVVRTTHAKRLGRGRIPPEANMFAVIRVAGPDFDQEFVESMQLHNPEIRPGWTTVKFLYDRVAPVTVEYRLKNEGGLLAGPELTYGVNGRNDQLRFRVNPRDGTCTGDLNGTPDGNKEVVGTFHGSGHLFGAEAEVTIAVKVVTIE